jgi:predicted AAA+ superfamily ATPase
MPRSPYQPRVVDDELQNRLKSAGAVLIEGPKACGKTETARQLAASEVLLDVDQNARAAIALNPALVLDGETPRLIDEWQVEPAIWNYIRRAVDDRGEAGQFILAGSAVPADEVTRHSGAGRIARLRMRPMSLIESGLSTGEISLRALLAGSSAEAGESKVEIEDLAAEIARGGWPGLRNRSLEAAMEAVRDYLGEVSRTDINQVDGVRRDPRRVERLIRSLARNVATTASVSTLARDSAGGNEEPLKDHTVAEYLSSLERLYVVENQLPWEAHLRSRRRLRQAPKRHFVDPSLAVAALQTDPAALLRDLNLLGFLFESLVVRDLRIYAQAIRGEVRHYRDSSDLEVDAIVESPEGWAALEIKLGGGGAIDEAAASLLKFANTIDTTKSGAPRFLAVVVASGYGYARADGVQVVPLLSLAP